MIITEVRTRRDLVDLVNEIGFLPFFSGRIEGFSLEENISYEAWYQGRWSGRVKWDAWDWKGEVLQSKELVYGKFFEKKAGFISLELWPDFVTIAVTDMILMPDLMMVSQHTRIKVLWITSLVPVQC